MNCSDVRKKLAAFNDGGLETEAKELVSRHLDSCPGCREELAQLQQLDSELDRFAAVEPEPYFSTRVRQRIAARQAHRRSPWLGRLLVPTGAAAAILFAALVGTSLGRTVHGWRTSAQTTTQVAGTGLTVLDVPESGSLAQFSERLFPGGGGE
jgi:anti-sigma factor RsiW